MCEEVGSEEQAQLVALSVDGLDEAVAPNSRGTSSFFSKHMHVSAGCCLSNRQGVFMTVKDFCSRGYRERLEYPRDGCLHPVLIHGGLGRVQEKIAGDYSNNSCIFGDEVFYGKKTPQSKKLD